MDRSWAGKKEVRVWDPFVRVFHWSLVAAFTLAYFTGDEESILHEYTGYTILGLVAVRVLWGLVGTRHARFRDFIYRPAAILHYARQFFHGRPAHYLGHNPLGGVMVLALLASLLLTGMTGYAMKAGADSLARIQLPSPVATASAHDGGHEGHSESALEEIHEVLANLTVFLVLLHVGGVIAGSLVHRENLVRAMWTGRKRV